MLREFSDSLNSTIIGKGKLDAFLTLKFRYKILFYMYKCCAGKKLYLNTPLNCWLVG